MANGTFSIVEQRASGLTGERFDWTADRIMPSSAGGARAAPLGPWTLPLHQAIVRTDYAGARRPSYQVLGPRRQPSTINGKWDDRYNFPGYAVQEMRRFEEVVKRGNVCRFSYQGQIVDGIITEFEPEYVKASRINYSFTIDVSERPDEFSANRSPAGPQTPVQRFDDVALTVAAMQETQKHAPAGVIAGSLVDRMRDDMTQVTLDKNILGSALDQRTLRPSILPSASIPRLAQQFRVLAESSMVVVRELASVRSDVVCAITTGKALIDYELWSRSMRFYGRILTGRALDGAEDMDERASPNAERIYRPVEGENLYAISRKFYGTPHAWRLISERNNLTTTDLNGDELLIIPERGAG